MSAIKALRTATSIGIAVKLDASGETLTATPSPSPDLLAELKTHKAEIIAILKMEAVPTKLDTDVARPKLTVVPTSANNQSLRSDPPGTPHWDDSPNPAAIAMEQETHRRLPENREPRTPPSPVPPLTEQGNACSKRGMDYLEAFWENLTVKERLAVGGRAQRGAWKAVAGAVDAKGGKKATTPPPTSPKPPAGSPVVPHGDEASISVEERKAMAAPKVPTPYLDAWAALQLHKPKEPTEAQWRQAIDDAGRFLDQWGILAVEFGWSDRDLFDPTYLGSLPGLIWHLRGEPVASLGPDMASIGNGCRVFDRTTRRWWVNPYFTDCRR